MTKSKQTKKALLGSVIALILCFSMLIGTTFAWFTDAVESGLNRITAGNLDIELDYWTGSDWKTVKDRTDLFTNELWEPGHTEVVYLRLTNAGTLALKWQLGINIADEQGSISVVEGNPAFKLSDFIEFGVVKGVNGETDAYAQREDAIEAVEESKKLNEGYADQDTMEADAAPLYMAVVVYMPEEVGNEANYKKGAPVPTIDLGIKLVATQMANEEDSWDETYDENAWHPDMIVYNEADLQAALYNGGKIELAADIFSENGFTVTKDTVLNLKGHTLTATGERTYLFYAEGDSDLTLISGKLIAQSTNGDIDGTGVSTGASSSVYFESTGTLTMTDVEIQGSVRGGHRAVEVYGGNAVLTNVDISTSYGSGVNAGSGASVELNDCDITVNGMYEKPYNSVCFSVMGDASMTVNSGNYVMNNTNAYATGNTHGGWMGIVMNSGGTLTINGGYYENNAIEGFNTQNERAVFQIGSADGETSILNLNGGTVKPQDDEVYEISSNTGTNTVNLNGKQIVNNGDGIYSILPVGMSVVSGYSHLYTDGNDFYVYDATGLIALNDYFAANRMNNSVWTRNYNIMADINATGYTWNNVYMVTGTGDAEGINLLGNGHTISNLTIAGGGMLGGTSNCRNSTNPAYVKNLTFDHVTVTGNAHFAGVVWGGAAVCGDVYFEDVHVVNSSVTGNCNVGALIGATGEQGADYDLTITFKDCSVKNTTLVAEGNPGADPTGASAFIGRAYANTSLVFEGDNVAEGNTITNNNGLVGGGIYGYTTWVGSGFAGTGKCDDFTNWDGITVVDSSSALTAAVAAGATNIYLMDGEYDLAGFNGKTVTLSGSKNVVIKVANEGENGHDAGCDGATVTFNGVTFNTTANGGQYKGFTRMNGIYNDCAFVGSYTTSSGVHKFYNCVFDLKNNYVWTWGASDVLFDNCTFEDANGVGKAILVHEGAVVTNVTVRDCTFTASTAAYTWDGLYVAAVSIDPVGASTKITVNFEGTNTVVTAEGATADANGNTGFAGLHQIKYANETSQITVKIDGEAVENIVAVDYNPNL